MMFFKQLKKQPSNAHQKELKRFGASKQNARGTAALELAILMPLLMLILFGIVDWGYAFYVDLTLTNAVREGARVGVTRQSSSEAIADAQTVAGNYIEHIGLNNQVNISANMVNEQLAVEAAIENFKPLIGFLPDNALPGRLAAQAIMRWELADDE